MAQGLKIDHRPLSPAFGYGLAVVDIGGNRLAWPFVWVDVLTEGVESELVPAQPLPPVRAIDRPTRSIDLLVPLPCMFRASASVGSGVRAGRL